MHRGAVRESLKGHVSHASCLLTSHFDLMPQLKFSEERRDEDACNSVLHIITEMKFITSSSIAFLSLLGISSTTAQLSCGSVGGAFTTANGKFSSLGLQ
mgnify:CR=1 FL=1